ncbi:hypothetical protein ACH95_02605 [Bacillus glycinifermentans]|uniref:DUF2691 family protein n=1 Tax=Bacillus glycinifermentans TaxID=1664069 RepID=A0A0J6F2F6_9BACI|nr:DUF2691 family protein [Bacillus glycinifermentans]ATH92821.1 DUF2691 domain-containing protein [Bacillus glycinifermentans]KMM63164.1 hypothetical protein ACH95_02605 [Bacillus glycinifermentans]KRT94667.1 hypothetical protein AB447_213495 [Bacillus glycinifermentans]MEC0485656.1 DUF2691 family protein [Bacillus glycinifermentans]MEC0493602.1 DUF2691 family protein [Bacillus glycinifermentans]
MRRGVSFEIPNRGGWFLSDMLQPIRISKYDWLLDGYEWYIVQHEQLTDEELFPDDQNVVEGETLQTRLENTSYTICAEMKAFPKNQHPEQIETYGEIIKSECSLIVLIADSCYVSIYGKDHKQIGLLYRNARACGFEYITDENDARTALHV